MWVNTCRLLYRFTFSDHGLPLRTSSPWSTDSPTVSIGTPAEMRECFYNIPKTSIKHSTDGAPTTVNSFQIRKLQEKTLKENPERSQDILLFCALLCLWWVWVSKILLKHRGTMSPPLYMCRKRETVWIKSDGEREQARVGGVSPLPSLSSLWDTHFLCGRGLWRVQSDVFVCAL